MTHTDKIRGLLFGLASGDQIGGPIRMTIQLSKSIIEKNDFDEKSILSHYYMWWDEAGFDTGFVTHKVFQRMKQNTLNQEAIEEVHKLTGGKTGGCNPMHRASPLALLKHLSTDKLSEYAFTEAKLTHYDAIAGECSGFVILTCRYLLEGQSLQKSLTHAYDLSKDSPILISGLADVIHLDTANPKLSRPVSNGGYSPEVLRTSIYFLQMNDSFESALSASITFAGSENYCPVIVGTIAGIQYGYKNIPKKFMRHPILISELENIATEFVAIWDS